MKPNFMMSGLLALWLAGQASSVAAGVLRVAGDAATQRVNVYEGTLASAAFADATSLGIQVGTVTADIVNNRAFFIGNSAGAQSLFQLNYTATTQALAQPLSTTLRITHLEWDSSGSPRLVGAAIDPADASAKLIAIVGASVTDLGFADANCCVLRSGVSAFRSSDDSLFLVGRRSTDLQDQLFRFTLSPVAMAQAVAIPMDLRVSELQVNAGGQLLGLAHSTAAAATLLFTADGALTLTTLGSGMSTCCFVMAGSAALDSVANVFVTLGPSLTSAAPNPTTLWSFNTASGAIGNDPTALVGAGLFFDTTPILVAGSMLFSDGFE